MHLDFFIPQKTLEQERIIAGTMRNVINVDSITQNAVYADVPVSYTHLTLPTT